MPSEYWASSRGSIPIAREKIDNEEEDHEKGFSPINLDWNTIEKEAVYRINWKSLKTRKYN